MKEGSRDNSSEWKSQHDPQLSSSSMEFLREGRGEVWQKLQTLWNFLGKGEGEFDENYKPFFSMTHVQFCLEEFCSWLQTGELHALSDVPQAFHQIAQTFVSISKHTHTHTHSRQNFFKRIGRSIIMHHHTSIITIHHHCRISRNKFSQTTPKQQEHTHTIRSFLSLKLWNFLWYLLTKKIYRSRV